ncbi:MAG: glucose-6-phosphate dehydrogenase assembly protein OpcA [Chloroflexi bacterium]|jgi:glucose-6-phosphate dehydrogenase assembly protein OpcA|nr:glucose-6-phosphate dehydrogenase assembly protein OpcA [Chloroflexota bacterium]
MAADLGGAAPSAIRPVVPAIVPVDDGRPVLRWDGAARSVAEVEAELARIWVSPEARAAVGDEGRPGRVVAARSSVLNLVAVARRPETGQRVAAEVATLTGRHPSRTLVLVPSDPDGPAWFRARVRAYCMVAREGSAETCSELVYAEAGGETGRHLAAVVAPLLVHDLPVALWWPGDVPIGTRLADDLVDLADRLIVDGSTWSGDGLAQLRALAGVAGRVQVTDFAVARQARWREALASAFDRPDLLPYLGSLRRVAVACATRGGPGTESATSLVKAVYHVGWLASRLDLRPAGPLQRERRRATPRLAPPGAPPDPGRGLHGTLAAGRGRAVEVFIRPVVSPASPGATLRVELLAERRRHELRVEVTGEAEVIRVRAWQDGIEMLDRPYLAPRRTEVGLLADAIESGTSDPVAARALETAAALVDPGGRT